MKKNGSAKAEESRRRGELPDECLGGHEMVVSATECTGLAPAITDADGGVLSAQENEAQLYAVHVPLEKNKPMRTGDEGDGGKGRKEEEHEGAGH